MRMKEMNKEVADHFTSAVQTADCAELFALDKTLDRHYDAGTIETSDYRRLTIAIFEKLCKFDCLSPK